MLRTTTIAVLHVVSKLDATPCSAATCAAVRSFGPGTPDVTRVLRLDRSAVRERFDERFGVERMARDYLAIYEGLIDGAGSCRRTPQGRASEPILSAL